MTDTAAQAKVSVEPQVKTLRILIVEDHPDTALSLRILLHSEGHEVRVATSLAEALAVAADFDFDLLLSDIGLPDGRGTDLLKQLRLCLGHPINAIAMTGFGMEDDLEQSRRAGFIAHLTKPVEFNILRQNIASIADK